MKHYVALAIILTVIVSVVLTIPTVLASRQLLIWLNTPDDILVMADAYIKVILREFSAPCPTMWLPVFCEVSETARLRCTFDFSSVLNIVLDIFFIVVVKAGTAGAAYATVISQGIAAVLSFIVMFKKYDCCAPAVRIITWTGAESGECSQSVCRWHSTIQSLLSER